MQGKKRYLDDPRYNEIEKLKKGRGLTFDLGSSEEEEMRSEEQWDLVFLAVGLRIQNIRWFIDLQRRASFHKVE